MPDPDVKANVAGAGLTVKNLGPGDLQLYYECVVVEDSTVDTLETMAAATGNTTIAQLALDKTNAKTSLFYTIYIAKGTLSHRVVTVAPLIKDAGYHTYLTGKWHLGKTPDLLPSKRGFERTIALMESGADNWEKKSYAPLYKKANWYADGKELDLPEDFYYSKYFIDKAIEFIDPKRTDGKPFFSYIPFQAVHIPVPTPPGVYRQVHGAVRQRKNRWKPEHRKRGNRFQIPTHPIHFLSPTYPISAERWRHICAIKGFPIFPLR